MNPVYKATFYTVTENNILKKLSIFLSSDADDGFEAWLRFILGVESNLAIGNATTKFTLVEQIQHDVKNEAAKLILYYLDRDNTSVNKELLSSHFGKYLLVYERLIQTPYTHLPEQSAKGVAMFKGLIELLNKYT